MVSCSCIVKEQLFGEESRRLIEPDLSPVVDVYEHALLASYPRARYMVGKGTVFVAVLAMMPEFVSDWLLRAK